MSCLLRRRKYRAAGIHYRTKNPGANRSSTSASAQSPSVLASHSNNNSVKAPRHGTLPIDGFQICHSARRTFIGFVSPASKHSRTSCAIYSDQLLGMMLSLSAVAIPVFLDTLGTPAQLYSSWARTYHYGHLGLPAMSVTTCALYGIVAHEHKSANRQWQRYALVALVTVTMVPFTWLFMTSTNNVLFGLHAEAEAVGGSLTDARELVVHWSKLHLFRSLFPLAGAVIGIGGL